MARGARACNEHYNITIFGFKTRNYKNLLELVAFAISDSFFTL